MITSRRFTILNIHDNNEDNIDHKMDIIIDKIANSEKKIIKEEAFKSNNCCIIT